MTSFTLVTQSKGKLIEFERILNRKLEPTDKTSQAVPASSYCETVITSLQHPSGRS